jgi:hypothetical protein
LLIEPNPESALNEEAGRLFMEDYEAYSQRARLMTSIHALKEKDQVCVCVCVYSASVPFHILSPPTRIPERAVCIFLNPPGHFPHPPILIVCLSIFFVFLAPSFSLTFFYFFFSPLSWSGQSSEAGSSSSPRHDALRGAGDACIHQYIYLYTLYTYKYIHVCLYTHICMYVCIYKGLRLLGGLETYYYDTLYTYKYIHVCIYKGLRLLGGLETYYYEA